MYGEIIVIVKMYVEFSTEISVLKSEKWYQQMFVTSNIYCRRVKLRLAQNIPDWFRWSFQKICIFRLNKFTNSFLNKQNSTPLGQMFHFPKY